MKPTMRDNLIPYIARGDDPFKFLERGRMRSALVVDVHNLYLGANRNYPGHSVDYTEMVRHHQAMGNGLFFKIAYGRQPVEKVEAFAKVLDKLGFDIRFGGPPYGIDLAVTVCGLINRKAIDHLILGSVALETIPLLEYARNHGVYTTVIGFDIPDVLDRYADCTEIDEQFLTLRPTDTNNVSTNSTGVSTPVAA